MFESKYRRCNTGTFLKSDSLFRLLIFVKNKSFFWKHVTTVSKADNSCIESGQWIFLHFYKLLKIRVVGFGMALNNDVTEKFLKKNSKIYTIMKKHSSTLFSTLSLAERVNLTSTVAETLAEDFTPPRQKVFTEAELWNIQRQRRGMVQRRFLS